MRTMISGVLILILWGAVPALAQLPPEIQADFYLLRAEQAIDESDTARAMVELDKIILLQKEHELDLPDEFHFRYAQAAAAADLAEQALEAVEKYLLAAGREGRHYVEALELMSQAQDAIEANKEPQEASNEPVPEPAQVAKQGPIEDQLDTDGNPGAHEDKGTLIPAGASTEAQPAPDCGQWNTEYFFRTATLASVTACLAAGADPMARHEYGDTPLHFVARYNENPAVVQALLAAGADPNARDQYKNTPLHGAARNKNPGVIEALLKAGADPMAKDKWNKTRPLHEAAMFNENPAVIKALLAAGGDPMARDDDKDTPLHLAARFNANPETIKALIDGGSDARAVLKWSALHEAAALNETPAAIEVLLKAGADPAALDESKSTPLHLAARYNKNPAVFETLLKAGADPMARDKNRGTPLHDAARSNENPAVIEALLKAGADPMALNEFKSTPLHSAAGSNENLAVTEALLKAGADPMARNKRKRTPLHLAAVNENPAVFETLLKSGADPAALDESKSTPLHWVARYNKNLAVTEALLKAGADPMARDKDRDTPLHNAAYNNENPAVIEALLKAGADLAALDEDGHTPLQRAKSNDNPAVEQVLLAAGAGQVERQLEQQRTAERARRKAQSGPGFLEAAIGIAGGTAIAAAGGGTEESLEAGAVFAGGVIGGASPRGSTAGVPGAASIGNVGSGTGGGRCEIPGYPSPSGGVANLGLAWCAASISMQARAFALQAAGAQCAIATGSSSTPEQIQARRREIKEACGRLAALSERDGIPCRCPAGYGP